MAHVTRRLLFSVRDMCHRACLFLYGVLLSPRRATEDEHRKEFLLNVALLATIGLAGACFLVVVVDVARLGYAYRGVSVWLVGAILLAFVALLAASRRGYARFAAVGLFVALLVPSLYCSAIWGIDLPQALLSDAFLILMTSVLFGTRAAFAIGAGISAVLYLFAWLETRGFLAVDRYWRAEPFVAGDGVAIAAVMLAIASLCWLANREIAKSLVRAQTSERLLREQRDQLEVHVEERTRELRRVQLDKAVQMHRFVEFGRMAAGFFHDLMSPLTAIGMNLEMIRGTESAQTQACVNKARSVTSRLSTYLRGVRMHIQEEAVSGDFCAATVLRAVLDITDYRAKRAEVRVRVESPEALPMFGDAVKFHQLAANLICNAVDACEGLPAERRAVHVRLGPLDGGLSLVVRDEGVGISPEEMARVWDAFYTTKPPERGMGIGLTTCKRVVELDFNGTIVCESAVGRGTAFTVQLPSYGRRNSPPDPTS